MAAVSGPGGRPRAVLAAIVADPALGPEALSHPATLFGLLSEYLPGSPGQTGPLLAAAQVDVPAVLRGHMADGVPGPTAIELAAARLAARTGFPDHACLWAASEFALALGLATAGQIPRSLPGGAAAATRSAARAQATRDGLELPMPPGRAHPRGSRHPRSGRRPRTWLTVITGAVLAAGAIGIALHPGPHPADRQPLDPGYHHATPDPGTAITPPGPTPPGTTTPSPGTASTRPRTAR